MNFASKSPAAENADIRVRLGAEPLINLTGTLTVYGGASARPEAIAAAAEIMGKGVDIAELQASASRAIAGITGAEAGFVSACSAAGICMSVAGAMTGDDMAAIERLPDTTGLKNKVVIQTGHMVHYGHPIVQDIRLTGAQVVSIGSVNAANTRQLAGAIGPNTAAALFVVSHHCAPDGQIPFEDFVRVCHEHGVPVIVDLAAEYDITGYVKAGADITIHSAHKFIGGATAGVVSGRKALVRAAFLQNYGIARPMKVGKEGIAAAVVALQTFAAEDRTEARAALLEPLECWREALAGVAGVRAELDADPTGNPFDRLRVTVLLEKAGFTPADLVHALEAGTPSIRVRTHQLELGFFVMDARSLGEGERDIVTLRLPGAIDEARRNHANGVKTKKANALRHWPDLAP